MNDEHGLKTTSAGARPRRPRRKDRRSTETIEKILVATIGVMLERGASRLTAKDICEKAGVSRTTLYRHFPSKDELLKGVSRHIREQTDREVTAAVAGIEDPQARWEAFISYPDNATRQSARLLELEPSFMLEYLQGGFDYFQARTLTALGPVFDAWEAELGAPLNRELLARLFVRHALSHLLVPGDSRSDVARELAKLVALLRRPSRK